MVSETMHPEINRIVDFLRSNLGDRTAVVAVSGGVDSAVVLSLCTKAFDSERLHAYFLPDSVTQKSDYEDVRLLSQNTGVDIKTINIDSVIRSIVQVTEAADQKAVGNIKSRVRMTLLYYFANLTGGIVIGTTNRTEYLTGYFTKYGDGGVDIEPIEHLYKFEVLELASLLDIPVSIREKKPSAGLFAGQTDEEDLGMTYSYLDHALMDFERSGFDLASMKDQRVKSLFVESSHKRGLPLSLLRNTGI